MCSRRRKHGCEEDIGWPAWMSMFCIRSASQLWLSFTLMKPGPASVGRSAIMGEAGRASTIAFATSVGFFGAPSCTAATPAL